MSRFWCLFIFVAAQCLYAQIEVRHIEHYSSEQGLSHSSVYAIHQDEQDLLWVGTANGLNLFDGYDFRQVLPEQLGGLKVRLIHPDGRSGLWLGTDQGLFRVDSFRRIAGSWRDRQDPLFFLSMAADEGQVLWLGARSGLYRIEGENENLTFEPKALTEAGVPSSMRIHAILAEKDDLWLGTAMGLVRWRKGTDESRLWSHDAGDENSISYNEIRSILRDDIGNLWIGTTRGLNRYDSENDRFIRLTQQSHPKRVPDNWINIIRQGPLGDIWVGARSGGLARWSPVTGQSQIYRQNNPYGSLPTNSVVGLGFTAEKIAWVGMFKGGLSKIDLKPQKFRSYSVMGEGGRGLQIVRSILKDSRGRLWIGANEGLVVWDGESAYQYRTDSESALSSNMVISLAEQGGFIWAGTFNGGLNRIDHETKDVVWIMKDESSATLLVNNFVSVVTPGSNGVWVGSSRVVQHIRTNGDLTTHKLPGPGGEQRIYAIETDPDSLWVGTSNGLLRRNLETGDWRSFYHEHNNAGSLPENRINCLHLDSQGQLWAGVTGGVAVYQPETDSFRFLRYETTGRDLQVLSIAEDDQGGIWAGSNLGLVFFDGEGETRLYNRADGLWSDEFSRNAAISYNGVIYLGGPRGYNTFEPGNLIDNQRQPKIAMTDFLVFNEPQAPEVFLNQDELSLSYKQNFFAIKFAALDYSSPGKNQYLYKMEGVDKDWKDPGERRYASYTNIPGGDYVFKVIASNNDEVWNRKGLELQLIIDDPFWKRSEFYWMMAVLLLLLIWTIHTLLTRNEKLQQRELADLAQKRSDALKSLHQELMEEARKAGMSEITTGVLHNFGNILNSINVSTDSIVRALQGSKVEKLRQANDLLREQKGDLVKFLASNPKAAMLPAFYLKIADFLQGEHDYLNREIQQIRSNLHLMDRAVDFEDYAATADFECLPLLSLVDDALRLQEISLRKREIQVEMDVPEGIVVCVDRFKLTHVLINLIRNSADAIIEVHSEEQGLIRISGLEEDGFAVIRVADNGIGLTAHHQNKLFTYGFTTKVNGNGFGLHTCKLALDEMSGEIGVHSDGPGKGAVFTLKIPLTKEDGCSSC